MVKLRRHPKNPILLPDPQHPWESRHVSNAGAILHNGKVHLLYRAEGEDTRPSTDHIWPVSRIGLAISPDGVTIEERLPGPVIDVAGEPHPLTDGAEDARVCRIEGQFYATTSSLHEVLSWSVSKDLRNWEKRGVLMPDYSQRTGGLLPEKVDGEFVLFHRVLPHLWISRSPDLKRWHSTKILLRAQWGHWTEAKLGIGATPFKTDQAWVVIFHGKDRNRIYRLGVMWLDAEDPGRILRVQEEPILEPEEEYELKGFVDNVVYTCGAVTLGDEVFVYYGCGDQCLAVATAPLKEFRL
jgi:predicted GH43/DUF377 family glycosyl hydrolase